MKLRLFLLLLVATLWPALASNAATLTGVVVNGNSGSPVSGATVLLRDHNAQATTNFNGQFRLAVPDNTEGVLLVNCDGFQPFAMDVATVQGTVNVGEIRITAENAGEDFYGDTDDLVFDETALENDEGTSQSVAALTGANDNIYYNTASYNFGPMYFRYRGMDNQYQSVYINGLKMNDLVRGSFSFSTLLGMTSRAFRNKTTTIGMAASNYGFGDIAGSVNYNTTTDLYAPGFNGSVAFTNSNYMLRAMATYSTGLNKQGWAFTVSAIGRYAKEGVMEGTFYNSAGLFLSLEKKFNAEHSLTLTAFGGPTQRATGRPTVQEAYDLAGTNLYNPDWGYQNGKKRSSRITETFDPTVILNWLFKKNNTTLNTSAAFRSVYYNRTALNYYNATDPNPSYYKYLPSYFEGRGDEAAAEYYTWMWENDEAFRQIKWDDLYQINYLNNVQNENLPEGQKLGSSYIMENRTNHQLVGMFNSYINTRLNSFMTLQAGVSFNYTKSSNYKTIRDLLGGEFWIDIDPFSNREESVRPGNLQNDVDNPNRRVGKGDRFGYDYDIHALRAEGWLQNVINLPKWDINYGMMISYTQYFRNGHMRNGRAPENSYGKSKTYRFDDAAVKAGATYKLDGRNYFTVNAEYGTQAPLIKDVYISPRIKDKTVENLHSQRVFSADAAYNWNYRRFRGSVGVFFTNITGAIERMGFYDESLNTFVNFALSDVHRQYKGVELGMAYKILPSLTASVAGTYSRYQYKNNPMGTRSAENELTDPQDKRVYLKNYFCTSTPQAAMNIALDYAAPKNWYFNVNATWMGDYYVQLAYPYHEEMPDIWTVASTYEEAEAIVDAFATQEKLPCNWVLNASIGKSIYFNRKVGLNFNLSVSNILNNTNLVTNAFQQSRVDTKKYNPKAYPTKYQYAQGVKVYFNVGVRF